jgi:hypothetical protein
MAAATTITVNDSSAVAHNFQPSKKNGDLVQYSEKTTSHTASGFYDMRISQVMDSPAVVRSKISLLIPLEVLDSATGLYSYPSSMRFTCEVLLPKAATATQRNDMAFYLKNIMSHSVVQDLLHNLDAPF